MIGNTETILPPKQVQNFQLTSMRNDLQGMQKTIDKLRNDFEITVSEIPPQLSQKLQVIKQKQKNIASLVDKERFKAYQSRFLHLQAKITDLRKRVNNYTIVSAQRAQDDRFEKAFLKLKDSVATESAQIRGEIYQKAMSRIDSYNTKAETTRNFQNLEFQSSLSVLPNDPQKYSTVYKDEIDNSVLISRLDKTQERIQKAIDDFGVFQQRKMRAANKKPEDVSEELAQQIEECHQNLLKYKISYSNLKTDLMSRAKVKVVDIIMEKTVQDTSQVVTNKDFTDWCQNITHALNVVSGDIGNYVTKADTSLNIVEKKIEDLSDEISSVYSRVTEIDKTINDFNEELSSHVDQKINDSSNIHEVDMAAVKEIFQEFRDAFQEARDKMKQEIRETKMRLDEAEDLIREKM